MVPGIDSFREKFKDYTDYYTIIGGRKPGPRMK